MWFFLMGRNKRNVKRKSKLNRESFQKKINSPLFDLTPLSSFNIVIHSPDRLVNMGALCG